MWLESFNGSSAISHVTKDLANSTPELENVISKSSQFKLAIGHIIILNAKYFQLFTCIFMHGCRCEWKWKWLRAFKIKLLVYYHNPKTGWNFCAMNVIEIIGFYKLFRLNGIFLFNYLSKANLLNSFYCFYTDTFCLFVRFSLLSLRWKERSLILTRMASFSVGRLACDLSLISAIYKNNRLKISIFELSKNLIKQKIKIRSCLMYW